MFKFITNFFSKDKPKKEEAVIIDSELKKEIITDIDEAHINLTQLFEITQGAKEYLGYQELTNENKYLIEKYQDYILYIARPLRSYEIED